MIWNVKWTPITIKLPIVQFWFHEGAVMMIMTLLLILLCQIMVLGIDTPVIYSICAKCADYRVLWKICSSYEKFLETYDDLTNHASLHRICLKWPFSRCNIGKIRMWCLGHIKKCVNWLFYIALMQLIHKQAIKCIREPVISGVNFSFFSVSKILSTPTA